MRYTLITLLVAAALLMVGCDKPAPAPAPAAPKAAPEAPVEAKPAATPAAQATQVGNAFLSFNRPFKRADVKVTDEQLEKIVASGYEVYETTGETLVRVFVFHYDALELVKPAAVARWINQSGLIYNGQTSSNRLRVIVAGTPEATALDEETTEIMNEFMDAFMVMR